MTARRPGRGVTPPRPASRAARGQSLVEFAAVLPLFVLLIFGIIDGGRLVYINNAVAEAAREGARWGSVQGRSVTAQGRANVRQYTIERMTAVPDPSVTVTCERNGVTRSDCRTNDVLVVTVRSPVNMITPLLGNIFGSITVSSTSKVVVHQ